MNSAEMATSRRRGGTLTTMLGALWSARTWRATFHGLVGLASGAAGCAVLAGLVLVWGAAIWSLVMGPSGHWALGWLYAAAAVIGPVALPLCVHAFSALQRDRFRVVLQVEIPEPRRMAGSRPLRLVRPWVGAAMWRQLSYHLMAPVIGAVGSALVTTAGIIATAAANPLWVGDLWVGDPWLSAGLAVTVLAMLLAAPWVARGAARVDTGLARTLLGPSRTETLVRRGESLARSRADAVAAADAERRRIERDLHDGAQQRLLSLAMNLGMARATLTDASEPAMRAIEQAHDEATQTLAELREFVRGLHPAVLNDRGLDAALSGIVARAALPVRLRVDVARRCSPSIEAIAYFVVSEALANIAKHAHAGHAEVTVERVGDRLRIVVTDDGDGGATIGPGESGQADGNGGSGLRGLAQRAAAVDGTLTLHSPPGGPTRVSVELPCES